MIGHAPEVCLHELDFVVVVIRCFSAQANNGLDFVAFNEFGEECAPNGTSVAQD